VAVGGNHQSRVSGNIHSAAITLGCTHGDQLLSIARYR
jgi:hypothetical protein